MKCMLGRIEFTLLDDGDLLSVQAVCEEEGLDETVTLPLEAAAEWKDERGNFSQQTFEEFCDDMVGPAITWE